MHEISGGPGLLAVHLVTERPAAQLHKMLLGRKAHTARGFFAVTKLDHSGMQKVLGFSVFLR